jgi:hypothetical protein
MKKNSQSSIWENLLRIMPGLEKEISKSPDYIDPIIAKSLYNIWRIGSQGNDNRIFKRPATLSHEEIIRMKSSGLIQAIGDKIEITAKGEKVIKIMILGDERSVFEDTDLVIDYNKALDNTRGIKTAKRMTK